MKKLILITIFLSLTACGGNPIKGHIQGGLYHSISREFTVAIPSFKGIELHDSASAKSEWVDFQYGADDWSRFGGYSLEWIKNEAPAKNFGDFVKAADRLIRGNIKAAIDPGTTFRTVTQRSFAIKGKQAKQVVGRITKDGMPAIYAATVINFSDRIALGIVIFSLRSEQEKEFKKYRAWQRYVHFMESLRRL